MSQAKKTKRTQQVAPTIITISVPVTEAQAQAVKDAGTGIVIHHPSAGGALGRRQLARVLTEAGVPARSVKTFGWSTVGAPPVLEEKPAAPVEPTEDTVKIEQPAADAKSEQPAVEAPVEPAKKPARGR
jgi:hypothetical protein